MKQLSNYIAEKLIINKDFKGSAGVPNVIDGDYILDHLNLLDRKENPISEGLRTSIIDEINRLLNDNSVKFINKYNFFTTKNGFMQLPDELKKDYNVVHWKINLKDFNQFYSYEFAWKLYYRYVKSTNTHELVAAIYNPSIGSYNNTIYICDMTE